MTTANKYVAYTKALALKHRILVIRCAAEKCQQVPHMYLCASMLLCNKVSRKILHLRLVNKLQGNHSHANTYEYGQINNTDKEINVARV